MQNIADSELRSGRPEASIDHLHRILAALDGGGIPATVAAGSRPNVTARLGSAYQRLGRLPEAADCFEAVGAAADADRVRALAAGTVI